MTTLTKGEQYDVPALDHSGWTAGDGTGAEGYFAADFFESDGTYKGADGHGIEPTFVAASACELLIFASHNNTDRYAILIDGRLGLYDSRDEAHRVYGLIGGTDCGGDDDGLAETPFGACQLIPPHHKCTGCMHDEHSDVADHVAAATDVEAYIRAELK